MVPAGVAKLADAPDLGSGAARRGGSSPFTRTVVTEIAAASGFVELTDTSETGFFDPSSSSQR